MTETPIIDDDAPDEFESVEGGEPDGNPEPQVWIADDDDDTDVLDDPEDDTEDEDTIELTDEDLAAIDAAELEEG